MGILLGFAPFIAFAVLSGSLSSTTCLWIAAAVSVVPILRELAADRSMKILEIGTLLLFGGLAIYTGVAHAHWDLWTVRIVVDGGLLAIVLVSLLVLMPFTLQYAREQVPASVAQTAGFRRVNYIITAVWAAAMVVNVASDVLIEHHRASSSIGLVATLAALGFALWFTGIYPKRVASRHS